MRGVGRIVDAALLNYIIPVGVVQGGDATVTGDGGVADSLDGVGRDVDGLDLVAVVPPTDSGGVEQCGDGVVVVAGITGRGSDQVGVRPAKGFGILVGTDLLDCVGEGSETAGGSGVGRILGGKPFVVGSGFAVVVNGGGSSGEKELVGGETWSLTGLEHVVGEAELGGNVEVGLDFIGGIGGGAVVDELVHRVGRVGATWHVANADQVGAIHGPVVVHVEKVLVSVAEAEAGDHGSGGEGNVALAFDFSRGGDVDSGQESGVAAEEIVDRAIFLNDQDHVLNGALGAGGALGEGGGRGQGQGGRQEQNFSSEVHRDDPSD